MATLFAIGYCTAQNPCGIVITGSFDSECLYEYKNEVNDEYPSLMVACKESAVTYTAYTNLDNASVTGYLWTIVGDISHAASGNQVTVDWDNGEWGLVIVSVITSNNDTCTEDVRVKLIDLPVASASTVPTYTVNSVGDKTVYVCKGSTVQFIDHSTAGNSDIAGQLWLPDMAPSAATQNYTLDNVTATGMVIHRVYNNCGCYDDDTIYVKVLDGDPLELNCFGTVCENAEVTYVCRNEPPCSEYHWYVEGGTLVGGQGTDSPTVVWDRASDGYGIIGLDGILCGGQICPTLMSLKVPVIHSGLTIEGQTDVCLGEVVEYRLPLFGSTEYQWGVSPSTGVGIDANGANHATMTFSQPGTYKIHCRYHCGFLGCGPYSSDTLTVMVKPGLEIEGEGTVCFTNACNLHVVPAVSVLWTAHDLGNNNAVAATDTGASFVHTFGHAGRYLVTASHPMHCGPATFVLTVKDPPPPTISNFDPENRHVACPNQGIVLHGIPTDPFYTLVWAPSCTTASPQLYSGDSVTISYGADVCNVNVYNYDRRLQCQSSTPYVHTVAPLTPAPLHFPSNITVCPGSTITWNNYNVPDQSGSGMLYEWTLEPAKQYCASIRGDNLLPHISLMVNEISTPTTFYVKLRRTFCGGFVDTLIYINVVDNSNTPLTIIGPDNVCVGEAATFLNNDGSTSGNRWTAESSHQSGGPSFTHTFSHNGLQEVILRYANVYTYCTQQQYLPTAVKQVTVNPLPMVQKVHCDPNTHIASVVPALDPNDYGFSWEFHPPNTNLSPQFLGTTATVQCLQEGTYYCTVTENATGCSITVHTNPEHPIGCGDMTLSSGAFNYCTRTKRVSSPDLGYVSWEVVGSENHVTTSGNNNRYADVEVDGIGYYTVLASIASPCKEGVYSFFVDFLPEFEFEPACGQIIIHNHSRYAPPVQNVYLTVTNNCGLGLDVVSIPVNQQSLTYTPPIVPTGSCDFTFQLTGYGSNGNIQACTLGVVTIGVPFLRPSDNPVSITMENPQTCDNTPIELTAILNYSSAQLVSTTWIFGDGSTCSANSCQVFHTFEYPGQSPYSVSVTTIDNHGCECNPFFPLIVTSNPNPLASGALISVDNPDCPFSGTMNVQFNPHQTGNHYRWMSSPTFVSNNIYPTHHSGNYRVLAVNDNYCHKEASSFVAFKNAPTARIVADRYNCCAGTSLLLSGDNGPTSDGVTYQWTITGPSSYYQTANTPSVLFPAPLPGIYNVTLTVTNNLTLCSATALETVTVHTQPTAPTLTFMGSCCIGNAPVEITATRSSGEMHWSNGTTGTTARYNYPGPVWGYYYDPSIGCPSDTAVLRIDEQPDFDALLTGCYEKCKEFFPTSLPVYGFPNQTLGWNWERNGSGIANGSGNYYSSPLLLPLPSTGNYQLVALYGNACTEASTTLAISHKTDCDCDSITISCEKKKTQDCPLMYEITVTICNERYCQDVCPVSFASLPNQSAIFQLLSSTFVPTTIPAGHCISFTVTVEVYSLEPAVARFCLMDKCGECTKEFAINLLPEENCILDMEDVSIDFLPDWTNTVAAYFDFTAIFGNPSGLLSFWTEPPMVVNYLPTSTGVDGLGMIDIALLMQLYNAGEDICFFALVCENGVLCRYSRCIPASYWYSVLNNMGVINGRTSPNRAGKAVMPRNDPPDEPLLIPNPTTGKVDVMSANSIVTEVLVMDMHGQPLALFTDTPTFNVSSLSSGTYIIRIRTLEGESTERVRFIKLVKK